MSCVGTTPCGPAVPEYSTPFTCNLSYPPPVLKSTTWMGTVFDASTAMMQ
jgi:hypothetical protein